MPSHKQGSNILWRELPSLALLVDVKALLRAGLHKMLLLLFPGMLKTQGHVLIQSTAPLKFLFSHENLWLWMEPKRVPRAKWYNYSPVQCLTKGPFQTPAGASSTGIYLDPIFSSETSPVLSGVKCLLFYFLYSLGFFFSERMCFSSPSGHP